MDSITQALLGATIGEVGFGAALGRKALVVGAICGLLPDLDLLVREQNPWYFMVHHRGITHSVLALTAASPLLGYLLYRFYGREASWRAWSLLIFFSLVTHPLLDWCTSYGTQLFLPLTNRRFAIDAVAIIDPVYSLPLLAAVMLALFRRPSWAVFQRDACLFLLAATTGYLVLGFIFSQEVRARARTALEGEGFSPVAVRAMPAMLSANLLWRVVARDAAGEIRTGWASAWTPRLIRFTRIPPVKGPLVDKALATEGGRIFSWFADGYVSARVQEHPEGADVLLMDCRYGLLSDPAFLPFGARVAFDREGRVTAVERIHGRGGIRRRALDNELKAVWSAIRNGPPVGEEATGDRHGADPS
ncbi:MAG: metal-dependent hydrolase [Planctomycetota bacterium]